jgi:hypothetical protein
MSFELLANELIFEIFEYLPSVQLVRILHRLNARFDDLISIHFQTHAFDFRSISKEEFDNVCQVNLPRLTEQIVSLVLSDDDETPQQIQLFRSYKWTCNRFPYLRSLTFDHVRSNETITDILLECTHINRLNLTACYFNCSQAQLIRFINRIWSRTKLTHCHLDIDLKHGLHLPTSAYVSTSLTHLSIVGVPYRINKLTELVEQTPCIQSLALDLFRIDNDERLHVSLLSIVELNLVFTGLQQDVIHNVLQHVPNLTRLKIETLYVEINGYDWEQLICHYLPKLDSFQLKMRFQVNGEKTNEILLDSFRTPFWLEKHRWFIQYHYNMHDNSNMICLYTLPYRFTYLDVHFPLEFESTCTNNACDRSYTRVQHLTYRSSSIDERISSNFNFSNVTHLSIQLPIDNHLLSMMNRFQRLNQLDVSYPSHMSNDDAHAQLQILLDQTHHLSSLKFNSWPTARFIKAKFSIVNNLLIIFEKIPRIRRLDLLGYDHYFTYDECVRIGSTSLQHTCQVLYISVENRTAIAYLIGTMHHLRVLIVRSHDDGWEYHSSLSSDDPLVHWLKETLPISCSIQRDSRFVHHIRIWIQC